MELINNVIQSGGYNFQTTCVTVGQKINIQLLSDLLQEYHDREILQFLQYGWPVERSGDISLEWGDRNHKGATGFPDHIDTYIEKEIQCWAMIGPFEVVPFEGPVGISPLSTRPKKDSEARRVILDCSWPIGAS